MSIKDLWILLEVNYDTEDLRDYVETDEELLDLDSCEWDFF